MWDREFVENRLWCPAADCRSQVEMWGPVFVENHQWCPAADCLETADMPEPVVAGSLVVSQPAGFDQPADLIPSLVAHREKMVVPLAVAR